jgi:transcriptional regulator with XRE-family HTH domain
MSMRDVFDRTGLSPAYQSQVENGASEPGAARLVRWSKLFGVTIDYIVKG